jgi:hypothetical protein
MLLEQILMENWFNTGMIAKTPINILSAASWGGIVLLSWIGFGGLVDRIQLRGVKGVKPNYTPIGLLIGWGMALIIFVGGVLLWLHLAYKTTLTILTLAGFVLGLREFWRRRDSVKSFLKAQSRMVVILCSLPLLVVITFVYIGSIQWPHWNVSDDFGAYLPFTHEILQTGTFLQPYSLRRLVSYGGHSFLQAQVLAGTSDANLFLLERGLCEIVIVALIFAIIRPKNNLFIILTQIVAIIITITWVPQYNSYSLNTGVVIFLTMIATTEHNDYFRSSNQVATLYWVPMGILASAAIALRTNYVVAVVIILISTALFSKNNSIESWRSKLWELILVSGVILLTLSPWALTQWEAVHTLMFPLFKGNYNEIGLFQVTHPEINDYVPYLKEIIYASWPLWLGVVFCFSLRITRIGLPYYTAAIISTIITSYFYMRNPAYQNHRYTFPMLFAAFIGSLSMSLQNPMKKVIVILACFLAILLCYTQFNKDLGKILDNSRSIYWAASNSPLEDPNLAVNYILAQQIVPQGEKILVDTCHPYFFNFERNKIIILDIVGTCSPKPPMPMEDMFAAKQYLLRQDIHYIFTDGDYDNDEDLPPRDDDQGYIMTTYRNKFKEIYRKMSLAGYNIGGVGGFKIFRF